MDSLLDDRSDNKGPEPEGVAVGTVAGTPYAFLAAERSGSRNAPRVSYTS